MNSEEIKDYSKWQNELIDVAIRDFGYSHDVIEPLVMSHLYQAYYEDGCTPFNTMKISKREGL